MSEVASNKVGIVVEPETNVLFSISEIDGSSLMIYAGTHSIGSSFLAAPEELLVLIKDVEWLAWHMPRMPAVIAKYVTHFMLSS